MLTITLPSQAQPVELDSIPIRLRCSPKGPRLIKDQGKVTRHIFYEDKAERAALARLLPIYEARGKRIEDLLRKHEANGARAYVHVSPDDETLALMLEKPFRRGGARRLIFLQDDRPTISASVSIDLGSGEEIYDNLYSAHKELQKLADVVAGDKEKHPRHWKPLPTLDEFMSRTRARSRRRQSPDTWKSFTCSSRRQKGGAL